MGTTVLPQEVVVNVDSQESEDDDPVAVDGAETPGNEDDVGPDKFVGNEEGKFHPDEIDGLNCPICFEPWSSSGEHHVCCLPCGHIYGLSCIKKWLRRQGSKKCPQCKKRCGMKDIRQLYASQIVAIDGDLQKKVQSLEAKCASLKRKSADCTKKELKWKKSEADLKKQLESLQERNHDLELLLDGGVFGSLGSSPSCSTYQNEINFLPNLCVREVPSKFVLQKTFPVDGARLFDIDASSQMLVVARRLPGYGGTHVLTKVSLSSDHEMDNITLPSDLKAIKDVQVSPHAKLVLLASLGKKLSIFSTESNNTILTYDLPAAAWSCAWDRYSSHYLYTGLQNGMVLQFDMRHTATYVESLTGLSSNPIHTLFPLSTSHSVDSNIKSIITASSIGLCQWNFGSSEQRSCLIPESGAEGVCISASYSKLSNHIVASYRAKIESFQPTPTPPGLPPRGIHVLYCRSGSTYQKLRQTCSTVNAIRLPKSCIIDGVYPNPAFAYVDELTRQLMFQELPSFTIVDFLPQCPILDIKFKQVLNVGILACICNDTMKLFTANLS